MGNGGNRISPDSHPRASGRCRAENRVPASMLGQGFDPSSSGKGAMSFEGWGELMSCPGGAVTGTVQFVPCLALLYSSVLLLLDLRSLCVCTWGSVCVWL